MATARSTVHAQFARGQPSTDMCSLCQSQRQAHTVFKIRLGGARLGRPLHSEVLRTSLVGQSSSLHSGVPAPTSPVCLVNTPVPVASRDAMGSVTDDSGVHSPACQSVCMASRRLFPPTGQAEVRELTASIAEMENEREIIVKSESFVCRSPAWRRAASSRRSCGVSSLV